MRGSHVVEGHGGMGAVFLVTCLYRSLGGRFRPSKAAESRRGGIEKRFPPDPNPLPCLLRARLRPGAARVAEDRLNFRFQRKRSSANSPHCFLVVEWQPL